MLFRSQVGDGIARVHGLENCVALERLEFEHGVVGIAFNLEEDNVGAVLLGAVLGEAIRVEGGLQALGAALQRAVSGKSDSRFSEGFIIASLVFCVGPLTIVGSIEDGLGDPELLLVKSGLDGFASIAFAAIYGLAHGGFFTVMSPTVAEYFGLRDRGAIAPGRIADLVIFDGLERPCPRDVYKSGRLVVRAQELLDAPAAGIPAPGGTVNVDWSRVDFRLPARGESRRDRRHHHLKAVGGQGLSAGHDGTHHTAGQSVCARRG